MRETPSTLPAEEAGDMPVAAKTVREGCTEMLACVDFPMRRWTGMVHGALPARRPHCCFAEYVEFTMLKISC